MIMGRPRRQPWRRGQITWVKTTTWHNHWWQATSRVSASTELKSWLFSWQRREGRSAEETLTGLNLPTLNSQFPHTNIFFVEDVFAVRDQVIYEPTCNFRQVNGSAKCHCTAGSAINPSWPLEIGKTKITNNGQAIKAAKNWHTHHTSCGLLQLPCLHRAYGRHHKTMFLLVVGGSPGKPCFYWLLVIHLEISRKRPKSKTYGTAGCLTDQFSAATRLPKTLL